MKKIAILLLLLMSVACRKHEVAPKPRVAKRAAPKPAETETAPPTEVGDVMPAYATAYLDGQPFNLASEKGNVVLLNVWATWCGPCRMEIPELQTLHDKYRKQGFKVIGVSIDEGTIDIVKEFVAEKKVAYPIAFDPDSRLAETLQTTVLPTSVIIDRTGRIVWRKVGAITPKELSRLKSVIEKTLGAVKKAPPASASGR